MKKTLCLLVCLLSIFLLLLNMDSLSSYLADFLESEKKVYIAKPNEYSKNYDFLFVQTSNEYIPYSYQDLINIIFSTLNMNIHSCG